VVVVDVDRREELVEIRMERLMITSCTLSNINRECINVHVDRQGA
jgi:hypothetical protein